MTPEENLPYRVKTPAELDAFFATVTEQQFAAMMGLSFLEGEGASPLLDPKAREGSPPRHQHAEERYRWCMYVPADEADSPLFIVVSEDDASDEYGSFQDIAYDAFGLVDVMAFSYEPQEGDSGVERVLALLRSDSRMVEDSSLQV
jgi:hypothetical protein